MGGESSKPETIVKTVYAESDESKRARVLCQLENQLEQLKKEVTSVEPSIQQDVKQTVSQVQDAFLTRYSQLKNKAKIEEDIRNMFGNFPMVTFIVDIASRMITAMTNSKEMTDILRWQERKIVKRIGNQVYGIEAYYKVKILEETKEKYMGLKSSKDTVVLIAYKCFAHLMDLNPEEYPDVETFKQITF